VVDEGRSATEYSLGNHAEELARLDHQAAIIERPTRVLLQASGLAAGMRVLDLGTGLGHVARLAGEIVGPAGSVLGIERSGEALEVARTRTRDAGAAQVAFEEGDVAVSSSRSISTSAAHAPNRRCQSWRMHCAG
jgi:ubiquinone/menaquinone biosynthesis C-methylase UbiE